MKPYSFRRPPLCKDSVISESFVDLAHTTFFFGDVAVPGSAIAVLLGLTTEDAAEATAEREKKRAAEWREWQKTADWTTPCPHDLQSV